MKTFNRREYKRAYDREWVRKRRTEWFKDKSCAHCGSIERLELDHIDRATKTSNRIWSWSQKRRNEELTKCQVLCYSCHKIKTKKELSILFKGHGKPNLIKVPDCKIIEVNALVKKGMSERDACELVGISRSTYSVIKCRKYRPHLFGNRST